MPVRTRETAARSTAAARRSQSATTGPPRQSNRWLALQQSVGNRAVLGVLGGEGEFRARYSLGPTIQRDVTKETGPPPEKIPRPDATLESPKEGKEVDADDSLDSSSIVLSPAAKRRAQQLAFLADAVDEEIEALYGASLERFSPVSRAHAEVQIAAANRATAKRARRPKGGHPPPPPTPEVEENRLAERDAALRTHAMAFMHTGFFVWVKDHVWNRDPNFARLRRQFLAQEDVLVQAGRRARTSDAALRDEVLRSRLAQRDLIRARFSDPTYRELVVSRWLELARSYVEYHRFVGEHPLPKAPGVPGRKEVITGVEDFAALHARGVIDVDKKAENLPLSTTLFRFIEELRRTSPVRVDRASTYPGHSLGPYSVDLFFPDAYIGPDGFYAKETAVKFFMHVHRLASLLEVGWRSVYNDAEVAKTVNVATGANHVIVSIFGEHGANPHGPAPFTLHIHLDVYPLHPFPKTSPVVPPPNRTPDVPMTLPGKP